ncbi:DUF6751 family protein [Eubacterium sp.]|uniref:DUF6751 family protein n=1 Tax=Eubacterium sp. TaxID=142586 RepID=UPI0026DEC1A2|nr:DUF6751 family protein [Eubacterium sp.]MDO5433826.1 hypothetical protein [Eubacterium sp.]
MLTNADVTLFNKYYDCDLGCDAYKRTHLKGVNWQGAKAATVGDKGLLTDDYVEIYVPFNVDSGEKTYQKPKVWAQFEDKDKAFTFNNGDILVKGIIDFDLTGQKPNNLQALRNHYDDVLQILSVVTCDYGSPELQHWELGAR